MIPHYELAQKVVQAAKAKGLVIATAESCTGGMISASITDIAGSSSVFDRGFVTYSYPSKTDLLDVATSVLTEHGAVSEPVARQMAQGALTNSRADIAVAVTGVAGPGADGSKPEGLVWFGMASMGGVISVAHNFGPIGRDKVRLATVEIALQLLLTEVERL